MPEELMIRHCAPTLAGLKTASLFACPYDTRSCVLTPKSWTKSSGTRGWSDGVRHTDGAVSNRAAF